LLTVADGAGKIPRRFALRAAHAARARDRRKKRRRNELLGLTGDDRDESWSVSWSVAMRRFVLAAAMAGMTFGAQAADLPDLPILRGSLGSGSLSSPRVNWQGFYVGGQADYGSITTKLPGGLNADMQSTFTPPFGVSYNWQPLGQAHSLNSGFGAFAGYNWQWDDAILGIEANYLHGAFHSYSTSTGYTYNLPAFTVASVTNSRADVSLSDFGSLRTRFGWAAGCFMPYGFLGVGFGSRTIDRVVSASPASISPIWSTDSKEKLVYGYSGGFGLDTMIVGGLFLRAEYEYLRVTADYESTIHTARVGLGYKF
jgi:opacity protein-like surface antigen